MIMMVVRVCTIDNMPIDISPAYKEISELHSQEIADRLTYEWPPPEVNVDDLVGHADRLDSPLSKERI